MNLQLTERHLRAKNNLPDDFTFFRWECFPKTQRETIYVEITGGRFPSLKSGPNKGKPNYKKPLEPIRSFVIRKDEEEKIQRDYTIETGNCPCCIGSGKVVAKISVMTGTEYRPCRDCGGTGKVK